uniref:Ig-like domain-containing protein n=1 Tax=Echeneis naucrates TaxID=173247 RepID=A0A665WDT7_ECHNA
MVSFFVTVVIFHEGNFSIKPLCFTTTEPVGRVILTASSRDLVEFSSVRLSCSVSSGSSVSFFWLNGSSEVTASDRVQLTDGNANLTIVNVTRYDRGPYKCDAFNALSNGSSDPLLLSISFGPENTLLTKSPSQENYLEGSNIRLSCSAVSNPAALFYWLLNGSLLSDTGPEFRLINKNITDFSDSGRYICEATNNITRRTVTAAHYLTVTLSSQDLVEFSSVRLSCSVSSGSSVSFLWLNSSSEVTASDRVQLTDGNANLTIVSVTRYDRGPYKCDAFNALSHGSSDPLLLSISFGPENTLLAKSPSQENYLEGSNIRLSCSAVSNPAALFYWLLNGSLLSDTGPEFRLINVQMSQSGNYSCQAFNNQTMIIQTSQPSFISVLKNITVYAVTPSTKQPVEGNSVNLTCDAAGSIFIRKWKKNGADLALTDNMKLHDEGRVLCFQPLNKTDNGTYSCMISNPLSSVEAEYIMIVNYGPENVQITGPSQITLNETLTLTCSADSTPSATYIWKLNETETLSVSAVFKKNITDFSDSGRYICEATNNITRRTVTAAHYLTVTLSSQGTSMSIADISDIFPSKLRVTVLVLVFVFCKKK